MSSKKNKTEDPDKVAKVEEKAKQATSAKANITSTLAKSDDGTIQINITIPSSEIEKYKDEALEELSKDIEVPGFRKGNAPMDKVIERIPANTLAEATLSKILPKTFGEIITEKKIKPAIYPRFELISANEGEDWQVRAITCEVPEITLGDYRKAIKAEVGSKKIWTPGQEKPKDADPDVVSGQEGSEDGKSKGQLEQEIIEILLKAVKIKIPAIIIEQEVNARLSRLLERIEKLGLTLDAYLASIGKTSESIRTEYEKQAKDALSLDFILDKIALEEKVTVDEKQVDAAIEASKADPNIPDSVNSADQRRVVKTILVRRATLDSLASLV